MVDECDNILSTILDWVETHVEEFPKYIWKVVIVNLKFKFEFWKPFKGCVPSSYDISFSIYRDT
jgi:hypothetical protein